MGNKMHWILAGILGAGVAVIIIVLVFFPFPSGPTSATSQHRPKLGLEPLDAPLCKLTAPAQPDGC